MTSFALRGTFSLGTRLCPSRLRPDKQLPRKEHACRHIQPRQSRSISATRPVVPRSCSSHGLWLLPSSWDRWAALFEEAGYTALTPGWPDDPETVEDANANPEVFADKTIGQVADHYADVIGKLEHKPAVIGHSFGGLSLR